MPDPITAVVAGVGSIASSAIGSGAAKSAGAAQERAAMMGVEEQRAAREELARRLEPYAAVGSPALQAQMNLIGLGTGSTNWDAYAQSNPAIMQAYEAQKTAPSGFNFGGFGQYGDPIYQAGGTQSLADFAKNYYQTTGQAAGEDISAFTVTPEQLQQQAISGIEGGAGFQALARQGEEGILQNASATGGLRGGNVQGALAQFRPALLNQFIEQQYGRLGGMTTLGQNSAAGIGAAGMQSAGSISELLGQAGAAQAGAKLGSAQAWNNTLSLPAQFAGLAYGKGLPSFGKIFSG